MNVTQFLGRQSNSVLVLLGLVLLLAVAVADSAAAPGFETSIFYLIPVSFFAWFIGRQTGLITSVFSAATTLGLHLSERSHVIRSAIIYWNALAWFGVYVFFVVIIAELRNLYEQERRSSRTDSLTRIANRRAFLELLGSEKSRSRRHGIPLTLAYIDVDHFKQINDRFGHAAGDTLLVLIAKAIQANVRQADITARLGGDEFAVLLPEATAQSATIVLQKLHAFLDQAVQQANWPVTFSMGAVSFHPPPESLEEMISQADQAMYAAKTSGRDCVVVREAAA